VRRWQPAGCEHSGAAAAAGAGPAVAAQGVCTAGDTNRHQGTQPDTLAGTGTSASCGGTPTRRQGRHGVVQQRRCSCPPAPAQQSTAARAALPLAPGPAQCCAASRAAEHGARCCTCPCAPLLQHPTRPNAPTDPACMITEVVVCMRRLAVAAGGTVPARRGCSAKRVACACSVVDHCVITAAFSALRLADRRKRGQLNGARCVSRVQRASAVGAPCNLRCEAAMGCVVCGVLPVPREFLALESWRQLQPQSIKSPGGEKKTPEVRAFTSPSQRPAVIEAQTAATHRPYTVP
jgi:hypothetical protein